MSAIIKFLLYFIWAGFVPITLGFFPASFLPKEKRSVHLIITAGFLMTFALFEVLGIPVLLFTYVGDYKLLQMLFLIACPVFAFLGVIRCARSKGIAKCTLFETKDKKKLLLQVIFFSLLLFELYMSYTNAFYDGDDAYYVAQSLQTYQTGTMYHYIPYTGVSTIIDGRHAMALMPIWITFLAKLSGTHPTIVTHSMLPLILIPLADVVLYSTVSELFPEKDSERERLIWASMIIILVMQIFGGSSIYTPETFLITRTWQGKTLFANILIPAVFFVLLHYARNYENKQIARVCRILIVLINISSGFATSLAPFLIMGLLLAAGVFLSIHFKNRKIFFKMFLLCIPNMIYAFLLLRLLYPNYFELFMPWWVLPSEYSAVYGVY